MISNLVDRIYEIMEKRMISNLVDRIYEIMEKRHSYCDSVCFTVIDVKKALIYLLDKGFFPNEFKDSFGNVSWEHFLDSLFYALDIISSDP